MPFKNPEKSSEKCNLCESNYDDNNVNLKENFKYNSENEYNENMNESSVNFQSDCSLKYEKVIHQIPKPKLYNKMESHLLIQIRNARERNRIFEINRAFFRLSQAVPYTVGRSKRISKVKTLQKALQYITELERQLYNGITEDH